MRDILVRAALNLWPKNSRIFERVQYRVSLTVRQAPSIINVMTRENSKYQNSLMGDNARYTCLPTALYSVLEHRDVPARFYQNARNLRKLDTPGLLEATCIDLGQTVLAADASDFPFWPGGISTDDENYFAKEKEGLEKVRDHHLFLKETLEAGIPMERINLHIVLDNALAANLLVLAYVRDIHVAGIRKNDDDTISVATRARPNRSGIVDSLTLEDISGVSGKQPEWVPEISGFLPLPVISGRSKKGLGFMIFPPEPA